LAADAHARQLSLLYQAVHRARTDLEQADDVGDAEEGLSCGIGSRASA
jgi:hypothetical protein